MSEVKNRHMKTFEKNLAKTHERNAIDLKHLRNQPFSCEIDAFRATERFPGKLLYQTLSYRIVRKDVYKQKGRPSKNRSPQKQEWLVGEFHSDGETVSRAKRGKGMFIVAISELVSKEIRAYNGVDNGDIVVNLFLSGKEGTGGTGIK